LQVPPRSRLETIFNRRGSCWSGCEGDVTRARALPGHIQCRAGRGDCCHETFRVPEVEGELSRAGLSAAAPELRAAERG
jgi:hypothetical protein